MTTISRIGRKLAQIRERGLFGFIKWYFTEADNVFLGKIVEIRRNKAKIDGIRIDVGQSFLSTAQKSQFVQDRYERPERSAITKHLDPSLPVIELGGFIGVVACVTNRMLTNPERHIVVEANPLVIPALEGNRDRNNCRFQVLNRAVAYDGEVVRLNLASIQSSVMRSVTDKSVEVRSLSLGELVNNVALERFTLICDIEGTEVELVANERELLAAHVPLIIMEIHTWFLSELVVKTLLEQLKAIGFELVDRDLYTYVFENQRLKSV